MKIIHRDKVINTIQDSNEKLLKSILKENLHVEDIENIINSLNISNRKALASLLDKDTKFNEDDNYQIRLMTECNFNRSYKSIAEAVANDDIEVAEYLMNNGVPECETHNSLSSTGHAIQNRNKKMIDLLNDNGLLDVTSLSASDKSELDSIFIYGDKLV